MLIVLMVLVLSHDSIFQTFPADEINTYIKLRERRTFYARLKAQIARTCAQWRGRTGDKQLEREYKRLPYSRDNFLSIVLLLEPKYKQSVE